MTAEDEDDSLLRFLNRVSHQVIAMLDLTDGRLLQGRRQLTGRDKPGKVSRSCKNQDSSLANEITTTTTASKTPNNKTASRRHHQNRPATRSQAHKRPPPQPEHKALSKTRGSYRITRARHGPQQRAKRAPKLPSDKTKSRPNNGHGQEDGQAGGLSGPEAEPASQIASATVLECEQAEQLLSSGPDHELHYLNQNQLAPTADGLQLDSSSHGIMTLNLNDVDQLGPHHHHHLDAAHNGLSGLLSPQPPSASSLSHLSPIETNLGQLSCLGALQANYYAASSTYDEFVHENGGGGQPESSLSGGGGGSSSSAASYQLASDCYSQLGHSNHAHHPHQQSSPTVHHHYQPVPAQHFDELAQHHSQQHHQLQHHQWPGPTSLMGGAGAADDPATIPMHEHHYHQAYQPASLAYIQQQQQHYGAASSEQHHSFQQQQHASPAPDQAESSQAKQAAHGQSASQPDSLQPYHHQDHHPHHLLEGHLTHEQQHLEQQQHHHHHQMMHHPHLQLHHHNSHLLPSGPMLNGLESSSVILQDVNLNSSSWASAEDLYSI